MAKSNPSVVQALKAIIADGTVDARAHARMLLALELGQGVRLSAVEVKVILAERPPYSFTRVRHDDESEGTARPTCRAAAG
jgi:hypothetical protein